VVSAGGRRPVRPRFRPGIAPDPYWESRGYSPPRARGRSRALWVLPVIAGAALALLVAFVAGRMAAAAVVPGDTYRVTDIRKAAKITAFDKAFQLSVVKGTYLLGIDSFGNVVGAGDQSVTVTVYPPDRVTAPPGFQIVSKVFCIDSVAGAAYFSDQPILTLAYDPLVAPGAWVTVLKSSSPDHFDLYTTGGIPYRADQRENLGGVANPGARTISVELPREALGRYYAVFVGAQSFADFGVQASPTGPWEQPDEKKQYYDLAWSYAYVMPLWAKGIVEPYYVVTDGSGSVTQMWDPWTYFEVPVNGANKGKALAGRQYMGLVRLVTPGNDEPKEEVPISRGEFTVMLAKALGYRPLPSEWGLASHGNWFFADTGQSAWPSDGVVSVIKLDPGTGNEKSAQSFLIAMDNPQDTCLQAYSYWIEAAARRGLVTGYPPESATDPRPVFKMWRQIQRQEAVAIVARAAGLKISDDPKAVESGLSKAFQDYDKIAAWARPYVLAAYQAKLVSGVPLAGQAGAKTQYEFKPEDYLTRAQAAKLVYFLAKKNKKL